jgi:hypothetical protein
MAAEMEGPAEKKQKLSADSSSPAKTVPSDDAVGVTALPCDDASGQIVMFGEAPGPKRDTKQITSQTKKTPTTK